MLDLMHQDLYGWETPQSKERVEEFLVALQEGAVFPAVAVYEEPDGYYLTPSIENFDGTPDGGHHRAVAHYLGGIPLRAKILSAGGPPYTRNMQLHVRDMRVV